jgi:hypothetical protein
MSQLAAGYRLALDGATVALSVEASQPGPQPLRRVA